MANLKLLIILGLLCWGQHSSAQFFVSKKSEKESPSNSKSKFKPGNYNEADKLALDATKNLLLGNTRSADTLIRKSIEIYPTKTAYDYVRNLYKLSDATNANKIIDILIDAVNQFPSKKILVKEPIASKFIDGKMVAEVKEYDIVRAHLLFGYEAFLINKEYGNYSRMIQILEPIILLEIENRKKSSKYLSFDFEYEIQQELKWELLLSKREYDKAIKVIEVAPLTTLFNEDRRSQTLAYTYMQKGDYTMALFYCDKYKNLIGKSMLLFGIYAMKGDNELAISNYEVYMANNKTGFVTNEIFYFLALIDINKRNFQNALSNLDSALNHRITSFGNFESAVLIDRWKIYKTMGDAYTGLENFEKAKDAYNLALLTNDKYEPAIIGKTNLENTIALAVNKDKIAPIVTLLEPKPKRGLKITSSKETTFIKGIASDISGIKEVIINNQPVYAQKGGDFWGEIPLKLGVNNITITAIDFAGNKAVQQFEIERNIESIKTAQNDETIIAVNENIGKNYCLLIGAQNYEDVNIPSLTNPIADAIKLKLILKEKYNYTDENIITLFNPHNNDILRQLLELSNKIQAEDNLVIFYAGHGIWIDKDKKGYWLMTDAKRSNTETWLPNKLILDLIAKIPARHTLLITDACFSGSVFKTRGILESAPKQIQEMDEKISRIAITSGNDTEVPDESVFMKYLIKALSENKEKYLTAQKMFVTQIIEAVMSESKTEPRYGTLELAGHVGGDFIFSKN